MSERSMSTGRRASDKPSAGPGWATIVKRRGRWRGAPWLIVLVAVPLLSWADHRGYLLYDGGDWGRFHRAQTTVVAVIDGDTLDVALPDEPEQVHRVRLWGVDTPEMPRPPISPGEEGAAQATAYTRQQSLGRTVTLHLQRHRVRGEFGRVIAYVTLPDGRVLNEMLLLEGWSAADDRWPHEHQARYALLEEQARKEGLGLWAEP